MWEAMKNFIEFCSSNWTFLLFVFTILGLLFGRFVYGISPLYWLEEIKQKQDDYERKAEQDQFKQRMVKRHLELADALLNVYELEAAKINYEKALELDLLNVEAQMGLLKTEIFLSVSRKDYSPQAAEKQLKLIQEENPNDKHALLFLGDVYSAIEPEQALEYYAKALDQDPNLAIAYNNIGYIYDSMGQSNKASENYRRAATLEKWNTMILGNAAYHSLRRKRYHEAIRQFEVLLRLNPKLLWAYWSLAHAYCLTSQVTSAYVWQQHLLSLLDDEAVTSLPLNRGELLFHAGEEVLYIVGLPQMRCYSYYSMALSCHLLGKQAEADAFIQKARNVDAADKTPSKKLLLAYVSELQREQSGYNGLLQDFRARYFETEKEGTF